MNPVMALQYFINGVEQDDPAMMLWTAPIDGYYTSDDDYHTSLLEIPRMGYVIVRHKEPLTAGQAHDFKDNYSELGRRDAGRFVIALLTALIRNSDELVATYIDQVIG